MADAVPQPDLMRSLGRLARGLSALFWGLPLALVVCVGIASAGWLTSFWILPPLTVTGLLLFGVWQLGAFQRQERPWRAAVDRALLLAVVNIGLSPFLYWWNRVPDHPFFTTVVSILVFGALLFLLQLNVVLQRLGAMLPDETLRLEIRQYTALNLNLLVGVLILGIGYLLLAPAIGHGLSLISDEPGHIGNLRLPGWIPPAIFDPGAPWLLWTVICLLVLLPLAMTMALIWKTKEVILESVFSGHR